jgi:hypothetical protein
MALRLLVCLLTVLGADTALAGAWLQKKGEWLVLTQVTHYATSEYFDADGTTQKQSRFRKYELQPYAEYGLFDNLTIGGSAYLQRVSQAGGNNTGLADPELWARTTLWEDSRQRVALQPLIKLRSVFESEGTPRGGSRSTDLELSALYGRNLNIISARDYADLRVGYRMRNRGLSDQVRADAALGLQLAPAWQIVPAVRGVFATDGRDTATFSENGDLDYALVKAEVMTSYQLDETRWVQASIFDHIAGAQTGSGRGFTLGYGARF